jgi:hypothetical protein
MLLTGPPPNNRGKGRQMLILIVFAVARHLTALLIQFLVIIILTTAIHSDCSANTFSDEDFQIWDNLSKKIEEMVSDNASIVPSISGREKLCLGQITDALYDTMYFATNISLLLSTDRKMVSPVDDFSLAVLIFIISGNNHKQIERKRGLVNYMISSCQDSALISNKANTALSVFTEVETMFKTIYRRVEPLVKTLQPH